MNRPKHTARPLLYSLLIIFYIWLAWNIPYASDDWDWGLDYGIRHLLTADINSRYCGNLLIVLMSRSKPLQAVLMGLSFFGIPFLMARLVTCRTEDRRFFLLCFLSAGIFFLGTDPHIWCETLGWISGFANYGFSLLGVLLCLFPALPLFDEKQLSPPRWTYHWNVRHLWLFLLSFATQLFLENLTVYMLLYTGALCVICLCRERTLQKQYLALFAGALAGLLVMFSSSIYPELLSSGVSSTAYRSLSFEQQAGFSQMLLRILYVFMEKAPWIWERNVILCCAASVLLSFLLIKKKEAAPTAARVLLVLPDLLSIVYFVLCGHFELGKYYLYIHGWQGPVELAVNLGYFLFVTVQVVLLYRKRQGHMWKLLCLWISAPAVILPLTVLKLEGFRFFLTSNCFLGVFVLFLLTDAAKMLTSRELRRLTALTLAVLLCFCLHFFALFRQVSLCSRQREAILEQARVTGAKTVILPTYPAAARPYLWDVDPTEEGREYFFRLFHGLQWDTELIFSQE